MNIGLRALLLVAAIVCFIIAIFSDVHQGDWIAIGLAISVGAVLVGEMGLDRTFGTTRRRTS
jgi:ABC-type uncharacterized transport system permease subunit